MVYETGNLLLIYWCFELEKNTVNTFRLTMISM